MGKTSGTSSNDKLRSLTMTSSSENVRKPSSEVDEAAPAPVTTEEAPRGEEEVEEEEQMEVEEGEETREE